MQGAGRKFFLARGCKFFLLIFIFVNLAAPSPQAADEGMAIWCKISTPYPEWIRPLSPEQNLQKGAVVRHSHFLEKAIHCWINS